MESQHSFFVLKSFWRKAPLCVPPGCVLLKMRSCIWSWTPRSPLTHRHLLNMVLFLNSRAAVTDFWKTGMIVHSPVPSPPVVNAPDSHFCLCGVGREGSEARACSLQVVHFVFLSVPPAGPGPCSGVSSPPPGTVRFTLVSLAQSSAQMVIQDAGAVGSALLNAALCWPHRRGEAGTASPTKWAIFMDPCRQDSVKWSRTAFYFAWKHYDK